MKLKRQRTPKYRIQVGKEVIVQEASHLNALERVLFALVPSKTTRTFDSRRMQLREIRYKYALGKLQILEDHPA
jgi:hypothetical protein